MGLVLTQSVSVYLSRRVETLNERYLGGTKNYRRLFRSNSVIFPIRHVGKLNISIDELDWYVLRHKMLR